MELVALSYLTKVAQTSGRKEMQTKTHQMPKQGFRESTLTPHHW